MSVAGYSSSKAANREVMRDTEFASRKIDIRDELDRQYLQAVTSDQNGDVAKAWLNFRRVGEIRYAVSRSARIAGYARLRAVKTNAAGEITQEKSTGVEAEIVGGITSRFGGVRGLIERYYTLMNVPGQAFLSAVREKPDDPIDGYWFLSASEIAREGDPVTQAKAGEAQVWRMRRFAAANGETGVFERRIAPNDFLGRVWVPDPEFCDDASTPMQSIQGMCEQLSDLRDSISARLRSRFAHSGILLIPNEIQDAAISGEKPRDGLYSSDKVMNYLIHVMTTNVINHTQGLAAMPILLKGPAAVLDKVKHIIEEATIADTDLKLRAELIDGILMALNQAKQSVKGGEGMSHWGVWAVDDSERRVTVQPDLDAMCHALTRLVLRPQLQGRNRKKAGDIGSWHVWYDLSAAAVRANMDEDARQMWDRVGISTSYMRMLTGIPETAAPSNDEYVRQVGIIMKNPVLACHGLEGIEVDWDKASAWGQAPGPTADSPAGDQQAGPGAGDPGSPSGGDSDAPKSERPEA